jgi:GNAT superfamily N-acetyltransferase
VNNNEYVIKDGLNQMDFNRVTEMLSHAFWSPNIKIDEVRTGAENSALVVGAFLKTNGEQIGYARVISDRTRFAYILDVYIDEKLRKKGIGQSLIHYILNHDHLKNVYQWLLITKDAHEVYRKVGFDILKRPEDWMEIKKERPDR